MGTLVVGLILFLGIHSVSIINASWRNRAAARLGTLGWQFIYSVVAIAGLLLIIQGYGLARQEMLIVYQPPTWLRHIAMLLLVFVFPLLFATYLPGRIKSTVRHPMLAATKLWAFAHLLANGSLADIVLFGSFLIWAVADMISVKRRIPLPVPGAPPSRFNDILAVTLGLGLYAAFVFGLHARLIGVPVIG